MAFSRQHMRVPSKAGLALNKQGILRLPYLALFVESYGQGNIEGFRSRCRSNREYA